MGKLDQPGQQVPYSVSAGNHYDFLHINLQKAPTTDVLNWAQGVVNANLGKPTIISTHDYLTSDTTRSTAGDAIWNSLVNNNPQVFLTLNGHTHAPAGVARMVSNNAENKAVLQVLSDFEDYTTQPSGDVNTGYLRKIIFDTDNKKIAVQTYSPTYAAVPWITDDAHQFSYDLALLPQVPGTATGPIFVTRAAACASAGYSQDFGGVPGPTGTALPLGWTVWQIAGSGTSDGLHYLDVLNNSHAEGLKVSGTGQGVGGIDGQGSTVVLAGADLAATYINQDTLAILSAPGSPGTVTLRPIASTEFAGQAGANQVPEPGTLFLLVLGCLSLLVVGSCRRKR